ncbi:histidinol-phosphatase [Microvirga terricola]|uniref:Histidinol-phosphatase n=1 Tax=Microvirga terricola TaxID=2719797 RepID=A0ABX0V865_9HYPH|nr:histidinol-phosphatase [Microvirga terricola]NIX76043.1 histidinol-phosphatase [Microvirga terricola]
MQRHASGDFRRIAAFAEELTALAAPIALRYFRQKLLVESKADASPVTIADREIELAVRHKIRERFPDHGLFGEEHGLDKAEAERMWVIDPIDGTKSFISGMPTFGTLIAYLESGTPKVGVIDHPVLRERWVGQAGEVTRYNGQPCATSGKTKLSDAILYATTPDIFTGRDRDCFEALSKRVALRRFGGDCYAYALLASGHVDVVAEVDLQPYDYLSLVPVIEGAGGVITDWSGKALGLNSDGRVVAAATPALHAEVLAALKG